MRRITVVYRSFMSFHNRTLFLLDVIFKLIFCVFVLPLLSYYLNYVMRLWGQSYITLANLPSFLSFPPTLIFCVLLMIVFTVFLFIEEATLINYCCLPDTVSKPRLPMIMSSGFKKAAHCVHKGTFLLPFYSILLFLFASLTILAGITIYARIDLAGGASDAIFIKGLIILALIFICFISFHGIFALYYCINGHQSLTDGIAWSKQLLKGRGLKTAARLLVYNILLTAGFYLFYYILLFLAALLVYLFTEKSMVITAFLSAYPKINHYTFLFFGSIALTTNINILSSLFMSYHSTGYASANSFTHQNQPSDGISSMPDSGKRQPTGPFASEKHMKAENDQRCGQPVNPCPPAKPQGIERKHSFAGTVILIAILVAGVLNFYLSVRNNTFYLKDALSGILITSHRGNSHVAPENTLPALENAIIACSDYAEIDIRQTGDGEIVLLHDENLWRTTGVNRNIWELTYAQVQELDAGSWFGPEFKHTKIPALEEAFELCKGRIKLNIEIKADSHERNIEEKLVALISKYDFEHQCVVSSMDYNTLAKVKALDSDIKTGLVISATYGDFYNRANIDFFSIRRGFLSKSVVNNIHKAGKEVHVWTVDTAGDIERMKALGVDCIITDNPTLAREVLYRNDKNESLIKLLNRMLSNRSFYKIVRGFS